MKKILFFFFIITTIANAQVPPIAVTPGYFNLTRSEFNGKNALETVAYMEPLWRLAGNDGYNKTIYYVRDALEKAGFKKEESGGAFQPLTYKIVEYPMDGPAWDPIDASIQIQGSVKPLLSLKTNKNMLAINSMSTPAEGIDAEIVMLKSLSDNDSLSDVKGKIVFAEQHVGSVYRWAIKRGAIGVLGYSIPAYNQPEKNVDAITFESVPTSPGKWAILLSYAAKEELKALIAAGKNKAHVVVQTKTYPSKSYTLLANINGQLNPDERFVISAHVQEPGANDNASGVGTALEMARTTAKLVQTKKFAPQRTITFLWGDEIVAIDRYIREDSVRRENIKWGLSLDMVGENTAKTGGTFLIEKIPDPSAIWTRGEDKHSEWGGSAMKETDMFPNWFNDFVINRCLEQAKYNGWVVKTNPFEGGSDHTPFIRAKIPGLLMWHFTDMHYHTSLDRLDMVSADEMKNVGVSALVSIYTLINANQQTTIQLINEIKANAIKRLNAEFLLGKKSIADGGDKTKEKHIIEVWTDFYSKAVATMNSICTCKNSREIDAAINLAKKAIEQKGIELARKLD